MIFAESSRCRNNLLFVLKNPRNKPIYEVITILYLVIIISKGLTVLHNSKRFFKVGGIKEQIDLNQNLKSTLPFR